MNFSYRIRSLWYLTCCKIFLSAAIISINHIRSTSALKIEQDQQEIERSLHDFMTKRRDKTVSMKNGKLSSFENTYTLAILYFISISLHLTIQRRLSVNQEGLR